MDTDVHRWGCHEDREHAREGAEEADTGRMVGQAEECVGLSEAEGCQEDVSSAGFTGIWTCCYFDFGLLVSRSVKQYISVALWYFITTAPGDECSRCDKSSGMLLPGSLPVLLKSEI